LRHSISRQSVTVEIERALKKSPLPSLPPPLRT
jgi:hypothetical protein